MSDKRKPMLHGDLIDAAAALVLTQHNSPFVDCSLAGHLENHGWQVEGSLQSARESASDYLVACFEYAKEAFEADDDDEGE